VYTIAITGIAGSMAETTAIGQRRLEVNITNILNKNQIMDGSIEVKVNLFQTT
jgi:hypothetical protein